MKFKFLATILAFTCASAWAQTVEVKDAWVRASVAGQKVTGAFMKISAREDVKLVGAASPAAGVTEVHEMKMEGNVMKMRAVTGGLDVGAGKTLELKPGGYHIMLLDLRATLQKDSTVPLTLMFKDSKGVESKVELKLAVSNNAPGAKPANTATMDHSQHKH